MSLIILIGLPISLQGLLMLVDEFYFHMKRGLGRWERLGHPLDSFTVLICFVIGAFLPFSVSTVALFATCALFSCFFVTKDEFVHSKECPSFENWLHALLFVLHPIVLLATFILWAAKHHSVRVTHESVRVAHESVRVAPDSALVEHQFSGSIEILAGLLGGLDPFTSSVMLYLQVLGVALFMAYQIIFWNLTGHSKGKRKEQ